MDANTMQRLVDMLVKMLLVLCFQTAAMFSSRDKNYG